MNDKNITQDEIKQIAHKQELIYVNALEKFLLKKKLILDQPKPYQEELFILNKLLKRNKAQGKGYAIIRDEVFIKSSSEINAHTTFQSSDIFILFARTSHHSLD